MEKIFYASQVKNKTNGIGAITLNQLADFFLVLSIYLYAYRGNIGAIVAIASVFARLFSGRIITNRDPLNIFWGMFILFFAVVLYLIRTLNFEFYVFIAYITAFFLLLYSRQIDFAFIFKGLFYISVFCLIGVLAQFFISSLFNPIVTAVFPSDVASSIISRAEEGYITGFTREVSYSTLFLSYGLMYVLFQNRNRSFKILLGLVFIFALFLTGKKAQPIFCIASILLVIFIGSRNIIKKLKMCLGVAVALLLIVATYSIWKNFTFLNRIVVFIESFLDSGNEIGLTSGRTVLYERALELWEQNKWFGIGWTNFRTLGAYGSSQYTTWFQYFDVHNCYLQVLCENGIVGMIIYTLLVIGTIVYLIRNIRKKKNNNVLLTSCYLLFFFLYSITGTCLYTDSCFIIFFLCISYLSSLGSKYEVIKDIKYKA